MTPAEVARKRAEETQCVCFASTELRATVKTCLGDSPEMRTDIGWVSPDVIGLTLTVASWWPFEHAVTTSAPAPIATATRVQPLRLLTETSSE